MKIAYISQARFPTQKAYGKQIAEVCDALIELGHEVEVICPSIFNLEYPSAKEYYDLRHELKQVHLKHFDASYRWWIPGFIRFVISMWAYRKALREYLSKHQYDLLYARSPLIVSALTGSGQTVCLELHTLPNTHRKRFVELANQCKAVVCLTTVMRDELRQWGVNEALLQVAPDGVALHRFKNPVASTIKLKTERPIVGYIGSLVTQNVLTKGVGEMVAALAELKKAGTQVHGLIVGGPKKWQQKYQDQAKKLGLTDEDVTFVEQVPAAQVPAVLKQCDALLYPAPKSNHPYYTRDTSPLKIFEYLAAGKAIVAANLPPIHDVLDEAVAYFCEPGDAKSLAEATEQALKTDSDPQISLNLAAEHEWSKRMQKILDSVSL